MAQADIIVREAGAIDPAEPLVRTYGEPEYFRRLTDKILAAFNHAYASGENSIAERLHELLTVIEGREAERFPARRKSGALIHAELWKDFISARDYYRECCQNDDGDRAETAEALEAMKAAYRRWSCI